MGRIELYIHSQIKMERYKKGMRIKMKVFPTTLDDGPWYTQNMLNCFRQYPKVEILWVDIHSRRLTIIDHYGNSRTILPEWIDSMEVALFI